MRIYDLDVASGEVRDKGRVVAKISFTDSKAENDIEDLFNFNNDFQDELDFKLDDIQDMIAEINDQDEVSKVDEKVKTFLYQMYDWLETMGKRII